MSPEVRRAESGEELAVAEVHVRAWLAAYRGLVDDDYLDNLRAEDRAAVHSFSASGPNAIDRAITTRWISLVPS